MAKSELNVVLGFHRIAPVSVVHTPSKLMRELHVATAVVGLCHAVFVVAGHSAASGAKAQELFIPGEVVD